MKPPRGKCFCENCEDCNWWQPFYMDKIENGMPTGLKTVKNGCAIQVMVNEIPRIKGAVSGAQQAAEESRNRAEETKGVVSNFGFACQNVLSSISGAIRMKRLN